MEKEREVPPFFSGIKEPQLRIMRRLASSGVKCALSNPPEDLLDAVGDRVITEVGNTEKTLGGLEHMGGENLHLSVGSHHAMLTRPLARGQGPKS